MKNDKDDQRKRDKDGLHKRRGYWHYTKLIDGKPRSFSTRTKVYSEAKKIRAEALAEIEQGNTTPSASVRRRFIEAADEYITHREATVSAGTVRIEKERLPHLKHALGNCLLRDITAQTIRKYQGTRAKQVSARTVNLEIKLLRGILKVEGQWKRLRDDVKPLKQAGEAPGRALTDEEALRLFETAESRPAWLVAYLCTVIANDTGMRGVELKNLRLRDIDIDTRTITIRRSKNDSGLRQVILTNDALKAIARLMERAHALGSRLPEHYILPAKIKRGFDPTRPQKGWRTAWRKLRSAAVLGTLRFHDMRHTFVTTHAELGTPLPVLQAQAGHLSRKMTELYTHISQRAMQKAADKFEQDKLERMADAKRKQEQDARVQ